MSEAGKKRRATLMADGSAAGERLDLFVARGLAGVSRKAVKKALDGGQVFVDGRTERRAGQLLRGCETVTVTLDLPEPVAPAPELSILYRDEYLLAVDKPAGLPAHPTVAGRPGALSLVTDLLRSEGEGVQPILLHRLDADTTGVLLFALTDAANRELSRQFAGREVEKIYLALVAGSPTDSFRVENHLKAGVRGRTVAVASGGQPAETLFRTLKKNTPPLTKGEVGGVALVEARPKTGRTHQIRAHLAGEGFPIIGDTLYGGPRLVERSGERLLVLRHLLHACRLTFRHPETGETTSIEAPLPKDLRKVLDCIF
jgi:23S rRNA pseudouridine1911/1915/1917 synthase